MLKRKIRILLSKMIFHAHLKTRKWKVRVYQFKWIYIDLKSGRGRSKKNIRGYEDLPKED